MSLLCLVFIVKKPCLNIITGKYKSFFVLKTSSARNFKSILHFDKKFSRLLLRDVTTKSRTQFRLQWDVGWSMILSYIFYPKSYIFYRWQSHAVICTYICLFHSLLLQLENDLREIEMSFLSLVWIVKKNPCLNIITGKYKNILYK